MKYLLTCAFRNFQKKICNKHKQNQCALHCNTIAMQLTKFLDFSFYILSI